MVPRLRHRIGIETLRRELDASHQAQAAANVVAANNYATPPSSATSTLTTEDAWASNGYFAVPLDNPHKNYNPAVRDIIPGFRTSAAFLSSLRTNLRLHASPPPSPMSTPPSMRASASSFSGPVEPSPLPSNPSPVVTTPTDSTAAGNAIPPDPLAGVPDLATYVTTDDDEKVAALKLVSDSIAQMRQTASRILIFHPANIAIFVALLAAVLTRIYKTKSDTGIAFTTSAGVVMAGLIFVRWCTGEYLFAAEEYAKRAPEVLEDADVVVTKFGGEIIGAVILGWKGVEPGKGSSSPRDSQRGKRRKWRAEIRGWAVRIRYRGKGVGGDLLEEAVKVAKSKGADSVDLAADHANSKRILWNFYNAPFDKKERFANARLQSYWDATSKSKKR